MERLIARLEDSLALLGLRSRLEPPRLPPAGKPLWVVRLLGGLRERVKFFQLVDPAISRKRAFDGTAVKAKNPLDVVAIEPLWRAARDVRHHNRDGRLHR